MALKKEDGSLKKRSIPKPMFDDEILLHTSKGWYIGKRKLRAEEVTALKDDARHFSDSVLWNIMRKDIHFMAYLRATNKAQTQEDIFYANAMYANLELLEKFIKRCATEL